MTTSKMTFHESYGDVSVAQLRAYKAHNVSPSDHDTLVLYLGDDHDGIVQAVKNNLTGRSFSEYKFVSEYV